MTLREIEPIASETPRVERDPDEYVAMQKVTRQIAFEDGGWDPERKERIAQLFEGLAPEWHTRGGEDRLRPTRDALSRGGIPSGGTALEIGSGTGIHTPVLLDRFGFVISVDLVKEMLDLSPRPDRTALVRADAAALPLADGSADAVVCVNAFVFPSEYARVLRQDGYVVVVATSGDQTPIYLPPGDVTAALERQLGPVEAVTSRHGWGTWTVVRRAASSP